MLRRSAHRSLVHTLPEELFSICLERHDELSGDFIYRPLQFLARVLKFLSDLDMLRAMRLALAASHAVGRRRGCLAYGGTHDVLHQRGALSVYLSNKSGEQMTEADDDALHFD